MYKVLKSTLLLALFACASAFTSVSPANASSTASAETLTAKKHVVNLRVVQTGPGAILASWDHVLGGPWTVTVTDLATNVVVHSAVVWGYTDTASGLTSGHTYRVLVSDPWNFQFRDITIV